MKVFKKILILLLVILITVQFYRSPKNKSDDNTNHIARSYPVPPDVNAILVKACYDCHSNKTRYPWYAEVQPVGAWLYSHVSEGKTELNFSEFSSYRLRRQYHKLEESIEQVESNGMPIASYKITHTDARLTESEKTSLLNWFRSVMDTMKARYPMDSLITRRS
jgi:hypothetical protein